MTTAGDDVTGTPSEPVDVLVARQAAATPDAIAVTCAADSLTYAELDSRAQALAERLRAAGVQHKDTVGVMVDRSIRLPVALLGVLKTGAAYVPIDGRHPPSRNRLILEDADVAAAVQDAGTGRDFAAHFDRPPCGVHEVTDAVSVTAPGSVDTAASVASVASPGSVAAAVSMGAPGEPAVRSAADPMYVLFTSGTTGRPKGVEVRHGSVANLLIDMRERLCCGPADVLLSATTVTFDIAVLELFLPLVVGARVDILPGDAAIDGEAVRDRLREVRATIFQATPAGWQFLVAAGEWRPPDRRFVALCGGEACPVELAAELAQHASEAWNVYGPTETTIWSTAYRIPPDLVPGSPVPIGRPLRGTVCYVVDPAGAPVPPGVPGELWIGGAGVANGYRRRPELTAERFRPDPFAPAGGRVFLTGDTVRYEADGTLVFLGRTDRQAKLRGFRVELDEVEAAIRRHPNVRQAAVVLREADHEAGPRLVAYASLIEPDRPVDLLAHAAEQLPAYMVPDVVVTLEKLPLNSHGKLDRNALPGLSRDSGATRSEDAPFQLDAPSQPDAPSELAERLSRIWAEVLGRDDIGLDHNFFRIGGHSLLALRMALRVRATLKVNLKLPDVFRNPTVRALAAHLDRVAAAR